MHWAIWCLIMTLVWCLVSVIAGGLWALFCRRRDNVLIRQGRMVEASYYPSDVEEAAILRAREVLSA